MGVLRVVRKSVRRGLERAGYPIIPRWRLARHDQSSHLRSLFDRLGIDCVLDVGANIGQFHEFLRLHVGYEGRLVSFEPVDRMYRQLAQRAAHDPRWAVHRYALGEADTRAAINVVHEHTLTSFLPRDEAGLRAMGYDKYLHETTLAYREEVEVRRLDRVFREVVPDGARVFLKSDTQGYDMHVIRGARQCLDRIAALQVELSIRHVYEGAPGYLEAFAALTALGFAVTGLFPVQRDSALRIVNLDCTMIRHAEAERLRAARTSYGN